MKQVVSQGIVVLTIVLPPAANIAAYPKLICPLPVSMEQRYANDPWLPRLRKFFGEQGCPIKDLSAEFLAAADRNNLDWRLLPSISFVESTGGKVCRRNNVFGWANGNAPFVSVKESIHFIAGELATSPYYKGKSTDQKIRTYNRYPHYIGKVKMVMAQIGPIHARTVN